MIDKFYENKYSLKAFTTRSDAPIDAITVSALAQRTDSPVILVGNSVSQYQNDVLYPRSASLVYRVGGKINNYAYNKIYNLLGV
ncbi:Putative cell wall binding repeat 2 [Peptostreptococcus anaerobius]|uniref:Cell wall binding repeat 2 n=1 Tax=Peptostreptococcus anaerobius TaxID=1261 RepID=A0A379C744_9FIRM|nr:cell wall-binding repeat-containing protein [Peptostreptococcus anaerobius]SUB57981.1 Putative cell wall binding repeat 2 [Peptostreptococcus anaerobius]